MSVFKNLSKTLARLLLSSAPPLYVFYKSPENKACITSLKICSFVSAATRVPHRQLQASEAQLGNELEENRNGQEE